MGKTVILNALIPPKELPAFYILEEANIKTVRYLLREGVKHYIGHPETCKILNVAPNREEAVLEYGDIAYIVRLKRRLPQGVTDIQVTEDDLQVIKVTVMRPKEALVF